LSHRFEASRLIKRKEQVFRKHFRPQAAPLLIFITASNGQALQAGVSPA
jgi:hypothetical protein